MQKGGGRRLEGHRSHPRRPSPHRRSRPRATTDAEGRPRLQDILAGRHSATSRRLPLLRGPTRTHGHHRRRASSPSVRARCRGANAAIKNGHEGTANKDHKNRFVEMRKKNHIHERQPQKNKRHLSPLPPCISMVLRNTKGDSDVWVAKSYLHKKNAVRGNDRWNVGEVGEAKRLSAAVA